MRLKPRKFRPTTIPEELGPPEPGREWVNGPHLLLMAQQEDRRNAKYRRQQERVRRLSRRKR
jgi:hypothetical protein